MGDGGQLTGGAIVLGGQLSGGLLSGGYYPGGNCPGGYCPGGYCPRHIKFACGVLICETGKLCYLHVVLLRHQPFYAKLVWGCETID